MTKLRIRDRIFTWILKRSLSLRYAIKVVGLDRSIKKKLKEDGGVLFLPNHPAEIDPVIIQSILMKDFMPRPLVVEHFYYAPGMSPFMRLVEAFPMPNVETTANAWKIKQVEKAFQTVKSGLQSGENFLIYPSGHLKKDGYEIIGGNSFIQRLIQEYPNVNIVLLRTTGLWGSIFSRAITGESPNFWATLKQGAKILIKNGIFFAPKRKVIVECEVNPKDFPRNGNRLEINKFLEGWYNTYHNEEGSLVIEEPLQLVSFKRNAEVYPEIAKIKKKKSIVDQSVVVSPAIKKTVVEKISEISGTAAGRIQEDAELAADLGMDSLDVARVHAFLSEEFSIKDIPPHAIHTVEDVMKIIASKEIMVLKKTQTPGIAWPVEDDRPQVLAPHGKTIQEAFLRVCARMDRHIACADEISKLLTYKKLKLGALVLASQVKKIEGEYVGILLPSSIGAYLTIMATLLAGKIPVMLNWTVGSRALNHAMNLIGFSAVVSSHKFLSRLENVDLGEIGDKIVTLEDIRHNISFGDKLKGLWISLKKPSKIVKALGLGFFREEDTAVILFTSGTETLPKAVPLSHKNILENQKSALQCTDINHEDTLYGMLPPFHSFGFNVTGLLPILSGLKVFYAPDPTDASQMAQDISMYKLTVVCSAPNFLRNLLSIAEPKQLKTVRLFVTGAERAPQELFDKIHQLGPFHQVVEGYGITECSPIVTITRPNMPLKGVGQPIPHVHLCVIDPETLQVLERGEVGEVCIRGPSVFKGYLGSIQKSPFIDIGGVQWYRSGDLGHVDKENHLILGGRLKRFVKVGGEMISLSAVEDELLKAAHQKKWYKGKETLLLSVAAIEDLERPQLILFTVFDISKDEANQALKDGGFSRLVKISHVEELKSLPLTGTGKLHYRALNDMAHKYAAGK